MGEALRRRDVPVDPLDAAEPAEVVAEIESIARLREEIVPGTVEPALAGRLERGFAAVRRCAAETDDLPLEEIGLSGELLFAALARHAGGLDVRDLRFLDNVIAAMRELGATGSPCRLEAPEVIADTFDRLLARFETV